MKWTHPTHARGVRSPNIALGHVGAKLTDATIEQYMREGRYGLEAKRKITELDAQRAAPKTKRRSSFMSAALNLLRKSLT